MRWALVGEDRGKLGRDGVGVQYVQVGGGKDSNQIFHHHHHHLMPSVDELA